MVGGCCRDWILSLFSGLVEEDVCRLIGGSSLGISQTKEIHNCVWLNLLRGKPKAHDHIYVCQLESSQSYEAPENRVALSF